MSLSEFQKHTFPYFKICLSAYVRSLKHENQTFVKELFQGYPKIDFST